MTLLARLDRDPWQGAARLAALAPETAALTVTAVLEALPNASFNPLDKVSLAARLVSMLLRAAEQMRGWNLRPRMSEGVARSGDT
jgi:hypothetical protein